jgi:hypothetical protein
VAAAPTKLWLGVTGDSLTLEVVSVPEPTTWAMMVVGFASLGIAGRRASTRNRAALAT